MKQSNSFTVYVRRSTIGENSWFSKKSPKLLLKAYLKKAISLGKGEPVWYGIFETASRFGEVEICQAIWELSTLANISLYWFTYHLKSELKRTILGGTPHMFGGRWGF